MAYPAADYGDMPVDPQIMQSVHEWQHQEAVRHPPHSSGPMAVDEMALDRPPAPGSGLPGGPTVTAGSALVDDTDAKLQRVIEQQLMREHQAYTQSLGDRAG